MATGEGHVVLCKIRRFIMGWECPICNELNTDDDLIKCDCGYLLKQGEKVKFVYIQTEKIKLSSSLKICLSMVFVSYLSSLLSLGHLPGAIFIEALKPLLVTINIFPNVSLVGEGWWGFYIVYNSIWPFTILFSYLIITTAFKNKSQNKKTIYFIVSMLISSILLAKLCFHANMVSI
jgi:hypothetical protein